MEAPTSLCCLLPFFAFKTSTEVIFLNEAAPYERLPTAYVTYYSPWGREKKKHTTPPIGRLYFPAGVKAWATFEATEGIKRQIDV